MTEARTAEDREGPAGGDPWGTHDLPEGADRGLRVGPLHLRLVRSSGEIWLAHARPDPDRDPDDEPLLSDAEAEWARWAVPEESTGVRLAPAFPDRPLVVTPEDSFHLVQGARARIFVRVPLWIRVELRGGGGIVLTEIPSVILSDTWFGDFMEGELCYFQPTTARRTVRPEHFDHHLAVCPIQLSNRSEDPLAVEKLALRVAHLSLFRRGGELWADETRVSYRGEEAGSEIRTAHSPPAEAPDATLVTPPRTPADRGFRARTFSRLKGLSGLGILG
ncbi:MAG TPA: hypothetical protein VLL48_02530 [Longimicrobiales bacterium]|nr:hypothetical protein [Longimicrobiales bacterium]